MLNQISSAISIGQAASSAALASSSQIFNAASFSSDSLGTLNQCFGTDIMKEIKEWIMNKYVYYKNKWFPELPAGANENSRIGKIIKRIKEIYEKIIDSEFIKLLLQWIEDIKKNITKVINKANEKLDLINSWLNNPCAQKAINSMPSGSVTIPTVPSTVNI